jgi:preprotein translocase subunit SecD
VLHIERWRIFAVVIITMLGLIWAMPSVLPQSIRDRMPAFIPHAAVNLGLDLQGGSHLLFEVESKAVYQARMETVQDDARSALRGLRRPGDEGPRLAPIAFQIGAVTPDGTSTAITITNPAEVAEARRRIVELGQSIEGISGQVAQTDLDVNVRDGNIIVATLTEQAQNALTRRAVSQSIEVIRRRIDETGTKEPSITRQGIDRIVVQAPGESDPENLKRLIGKTAKLTFQLLDNSVTAAEAAAGRIPPGSELLAQPSEPTEPFVLVRKRAIVDGDSLIDAQGTFDGESGQPVVSFRFGGAGAAAFGRATQQNVNRRFAIVLDDEVISAPNIISPILGGSGQITGNFTVESANELATLLRAGALPAPLTVLEQRTVGATQGDAAIKAGVLASVIAMVLVVAFMILAYGFVFGGIAIIALTVNLILIIAAMSLVGATLTLPGIAGLILTIGAAVDANVLIYERMREEELSGRSVGMSIDAGFKRAIVTVLDANVTALLTALILFAFGAGPVRGFAWTLSIGVVTSMFTAILMTQVLLAWWYWTNKPKKLPI